MKPRVRTAGFTLLELLVVVGLIAVFSIVLAGGLGGGRSAALQSAQAILANCVAAARIRAIATGNETRLLIRTDPAAADYRRLLVLVEQRAGRWVTVDSYLLPAGVYVLPHRTRILSGMQENPDEWRTADGQKALGSTALDSLPMSYAFAGDDVQSWEYIGFRPAGTAQTGAGSLVLCGGRLRPDAGQAPGISPVVLQGPQSVRGLQVSIYGVPRPVNDRTGF